jgi:hypothetical protein
VTRPFGLYDLAMRKTTDVTGPGVNAKINQVATLFNFITNLIRY